MFGKGFIKVLCSAKDHRPICTDVCLPMFVSEGGTAARRPEAADSGPQKQCEHREDS